MRVVKRDAMEHWQLRSAESGEEYSASAVLSEALGSPNLFVRHDVLPPGRKASAPHAHRETEELVFVLKGCVTAHEGEASFELRAGDCASFAVNGFPHFLVNESTEVAEFFTISRKLGRSDVVYGISEK